MVVMFIMNTALQVMAMVVFMVIDGQSGGVATEEASVFRVFADGLRLSVAANVTVEAKNLVGCRHHQMQVVGDHQNATGKLLRDAADELIELVASQNVRPWSGSSSTKSFG